MGESAAGRDRPRKTTGRSPIKDKRRARPPGESLLRRFDIELAFNFAYCFATALTFMMFAIWDWVCYWRNTPRSPVQSTGTAVLIAAIAFWRVLHVKRRLHSSLKGSMGERVVGTLLDDLRPLGYLAFHDLELRARDTTFNADHVLIGPGGLFVIETKYVSKPDRGKPEIRVENDVVLINGSPSLGNPIGQAIAITNDLRDRVFEHTGLRPHVMPVVVYPGWFVSDHLGPRCWVLNPERFLAHVRRVPPALSPLDVERLKQAIDRIDSQRQNC